MLAREGAHVLAVAMGTKRLEELAARLGDAPAARSSPSWAT